MVPWRTGVGARSRQRYLLLVSPSRQHQETSTPSVEKKALAQQHERSLLYQSARAYSAISAASTVPYTANSRHAHREGAMGVGVGLWLVYRATGKNRSPATGARLQRGNPAPEIGQKRHTPRLFPRAFRRVRINQRRSYQSGRCKLQHMSQSELLSQPCPAVKKSRPPPLSPPRRLGASFGRRKESPSQGKKHHQNFLPAQHRHEGRHTLCPSPPAPAPSH